MTSRERWTVYPLLFLAIGMAVRAAVLSEGGGEIAASRIVCRELVVETAEGTVVVHVGRVVGGGGGRIEVKDAAGVDSIAIGTRPESRAGAVEFFDAAGQAIGVPVSPAPPE